MNLAGHPPVMGGWREGGADEFVYLQVDRVPDSGAAARARWYVAESKDVSVSRFRGEQENRLSHARHTAEGPGRRSRRCPDHIPRSRGLGEVDELHECELHH